MLVCRRKAGGERVASDHLESLGTVHLTIALRGVRHGAAGCRSLRCPGDEGRQRSSRLPHQGMGTRRCLAH